MTVRMPVRTGVALAVAVTLATVGVAHASKLEDRVTRIETLMQSQGLIDMLTQLQQLQREVQQLRGEVEVQGNQLRQMQEQQRTLYLDIDRRLQQTGGGLPSTVPVTPGAAGGSPGAGAAVPGASVTTPGAVPGAAATVPGAPSNMILDGAPVTAPPSPQSTTAPITPPGAAAPGLPATTPATPVASQPAATPQAAVASPDEQAAYEQALNILREGRYADAAQAYRTFLDTYPNGRYADNAQYWLAETQYVTRQFPQALEEFGKVVNGYANSVKAPDALLKMGYIHYEQGDWKAARENLQAVKQRFPDSTAARLASERLQRMDREGR